MRIRKRYVMLVLGLMMLAAPAFGAEGESFYDKQGDHHFVPKVGFVPDEDTAIKIAEAIWAPIYGESLNDERPFHANLVGDIWHVEGSLPEGMSGGVAEAEIAKADGRILRVSHGK
ncbi:MAG: YbbC/YhhH family protein [Candidatus Omnitrophica bacterium]|nr:YbbC/YhhH family protein [Candidatus Omnitrophota bacterium]